MTVENPALNAFSILISCDLISGTKSAGMFRRMESFLSIKLFTSSYEFRSLSLQNTKICPMAGTSGKSPRYWGRDAGSVGVLTQSQLVYVLGFPDDLDDERVEVCDVPPRLRVPREYWGVYVISHLEMILFCGKVVLWYKGSLT